MKDKLRKILIFSPYYPPHVGGVENYVAESTGQLIKYFEITIFTPQIPKSSLQNETAQSINIIRFPAFEIIANYPLPKFWSPRFWNLFLGLFKKDFDATVSHTRFFFTSILALIYAKTKKIKWVHIEHGSSFVQTNNILISFFAKTYDLTLGKLILKSSNQIIAISNSVKNFIKVLAPEKQCEVIYRGFDFKKIAEISPNINLKNEYINDKIIIFIGRLISGKGVSDLFHALSDIQLKNVKLFIIGDGPEMNHLQQLTRKLNIQNNVIFFGYKTFEETISILKISDIFVNPSHSEGLPTTVIEAAICKKAIIATNVGGTTEIIINESSGIIFEAHDIKTLNKNLIRLLENSPEERNYMGEKAFSDVINKFDWEIATNKINHILQT